MITFNDFITKVKEYNPDEVERVTKAYEFAKLAHHGQYRQSGEEYIIHPLNVAMILAEVHADGDTLCAGLLHDVLEDTSVTKEEIENLFNKEVAKLVYGVTNLSKVDFSNPHAKKLANTRKIILGITEDVRIIIIKLADRLHNMRTLNYKSKLKQKEKAAETLEIFVPLAYNIGFYRIRHELEDLSLKYLKPDIYCCLEEKRSLLVEDNFDILTELLQKIKIIMNSNDIPGFIKMRIQNVYGLYKRLSMVYGDIRLNQLMRLDVKDLINLNLHDLLTLKIMVDTVDDCYRLLGEVHKTYPFIPETYKDYIANPKVNMYQSLHSTITYGDRPVQMQIRTKEMDKTASFGLTTYWDINKGDARIRMQEDLRQKYQFYSSLKGINKDFEDDEEFVQRVIAEIFSGEIYVFTADGDVISLPKDASPVDFAYKVHTEVGNQMVEAFVNGNKVPFNYKLQNEDEIRIITDVHSLGPCEEWLSYAQSNLARRKIKESIIR